jgi:hypothetical protein
MVTRHGATVTAFGVAGRLSILKSVRLGFECVSIATLRKLGFGSLPSLPVFGLSGVE